MFESVDQTQQAELDPDQFLDKYFSPALEAARPVNSCGSRPPRIFRRFASPREKALKEAVQRRNDLGLSILINRHMIVVNLTRDNAGALALAHEHLVERGVCPEERANLSPVTFLEHLERHPEQLPLVLDQRLDERACGPLLMLTSAKGGRPQYNLTVKLIRASLAVDPEEAAADHERHVDSGINMIIGQNEESVRVVYQRLDRSLHRDLASWNRCFAESRNKFGNERGMLVSRGTKILGLRDLKGTYLVKCERLGPDDWFRGRMVLDIQAQAPQSCGVYASFRFGDLEGLMVLTMSVDLLQLEWNAIKTVMMEEESGSELIDYWGDGGRKKNRVYCRFVGRNRETGALLLGKENIGFLDFNPATMEAKGSLIVPLGLHDDDEQRDEMRRQWRNRRTHFSAYKTSHDPSQPLSPDQWDEFGKQAYLKREVWKSSVKASDCNGIWPVDSGLRIQPGSGGVFHPSNAVFQPGNTGMLQLGSTISGLPLPPSPNGPLPGPTSHYAGMHTYQLPYYGLPNYPPLPYAKQSAQLQQSDDDHGNPVGSWEKASRNTR
ncbi:hypothetical protein B0T25DRAFT_68195 [Lasiosphaeria hispida]|uniref:Uncharacterized protein n=1 Tax=Lasiosphaeria hispida TaxID=260671 RepID=A0AAJ0HXI6_9PEZI|nr:hypothetical protein B0T25DRAFT_68195 [Lasiosphaeria hispida]